MSWKDELRKADVDVDGAISRFSGKEDRYIKYLKLFKSDENFDKLIEALKAGKCNEAFEYCHALKGIVGNLGFRLILSNVYEACEILRNGELGNSLELIEEVKDNYYQIVNIISQIE